MTDQTDQDTSLSAWQGALYEKFSLDIVLTCVGKLGLKSQYCSVLCWAKAIKGKQSPKIWDPFLISKLIKYVTVIYLIKELVLSEVTQSFDSILGDCD